MTEKGRNVINLIKKYKIYFDFTAKDLSQVSCEKIYPATLTSLAKEGILKKVGQNPCIYRYVDIDKNNDKELMNQFVTAKIVDVKEYDLIGELI